MNRKLGVRLGQKLTAVSLALFVLSSLSPAGVLAADMSSTAPTNVATAGGVVKIGNSTMIIRPGDMITDAQQAALNQVLAGGKQQLLLNSLGAATGGRFDVMGATGSLIIPRGVMALQNISSTGALNLTGNLANSGSYYLYSTSTAINQANITALNILNSTGAMLSTVLPSALMTQYSSIKSVDLNLNAIENIINQGTISSSGNLSLTAGQKVENNGVLQSAKNLDLVANNIRNGGLISALGGNININPGNSNHITFNNAGGTIEALLGNINVRDAAFNAKANFNLYGGDVFANALNINSGTGIVNVNVNKLTPVVNIDGGEIHVTASTSQLTLGKLNAVGDPTIYNLNGDVLLTDDITTKGAPLAIIAKGNILAHKEFPNPQTSTSVTTLVTIDTSDPNGDFILNPGEGGDILMIAGAKFTVAPPPSDPNLTYTNSTDTLTITGGSSTGGKIDLNFAARSAQFQTQFGPQVSTDFQQGKIITSGTGDGKAAGDVTLIAYKGTVKNSGTINLPYDQVNITANGGTNANNGNVKMIAGGGQTIRAILMGTIVANGASTTGGGNVELYAATPKIVSDDGKIVIQDGAVRPNDTFAPDKFTSSEILMNSQTPTNPNTNIFGTFTAKTGGTAIFGNIAAGGNVDIQSGGVGGIVVNDITTPGDVNLKTYGGNAPIGLNGIIKAEGDVNLEANGQGGIFGLNRQINNRLFMTPGTIVVNNSLYSPDATFFLGATVNASGTRIYQPDLYKNQLYVIDAATGVAIATLNIEGAQGTALSPDGTRLYVVTAGSTAPQIVTIDTATNTIVAGETFSLGTIGIDRAQTVAITPDGNYAYVVMAGLPTSSGTPQTVIRVDLSTGTKTVVGGMTGSLGQDQTGGIVINPQGTTAWVTAAGDKKVYIIDITSSTPTAIGSIDLSYFKSVATELKPFTLTMDPTGTRVYVGVAGQLRVDTNHDTVFDQQYIRDGYIVVIDSTSSSSTYSRILANVKMPTAAGGQLAGGTFPQGLSVNPTGTQLMVQGTYLPYVFSMYTAPNQVLENILVTPNGGPDGFGSTSFSSLTHVNGVPVIRTYASNTQGLVETTSGFVPNTISQIQQGTVYGTNVNLKSGGGNIILNYALKPGQNGTMTVNTTGTGAVLLSNLSDDAMTNVGASSAPGNFFEIGSIHGLNITGDIKSPRILLHTSSQTNSDIQLGGNIGQTGAVIDIKAAGAGNITQLAGKSIIGSSLNLFSGTGTIGASGQTLKTSVSALSAITDGTDVNIENIGTLTLTGSASGGTFNLTNSGAITVAAGGGIKSPNVNLVSGLNTGIAVNAGIGNADDLGTINLTANGTGGITMGKGTFVIAGNYLNVSTGKGSFGTAAAPLRLNADALTATTLGSGYFTDIDTVDVETNIAGTTVIDGKVGVNVGLAGIQSSKSITINGGNGPINIQGDIGGPLTTTVSLSTSNAGGSDITQSAGTLINAKTLTVKTTGGDVGTSTDYLTTNASTVTITTGNGNVYLSGVGPSNSTAPYVLTLKASSGLDFYVEADGKLVIGGALNALNVNLETFNSGSGSPEQVAGARDIVLGGNIGTAIAGTTTISATNGGVAGSTTSSILKTTGSILSLNVELTIPDANDVGSIGTLAKPIAIKGGNLIATAKNTDGSVYIASTGDVNLNGAEAGNTFKLTATQDSKIPGDSGNITIPNAIAPGTVKDLTLQTLRNGTISINADITTDGNMTFNANGTGNIIGSSVLDAGSSTINLISGRGQIGQILPDAPLHIASGTVVSKTGGNAIALNFDGAGVLGATSASTINGVISVTSDVGITVGGSVTGKTIEISADGNIDGSANPKFLISGGSVALTSTNGSVGSLATPINTKVTGLLSISAGNGDAVVVNTGKVALGDSNATNIFRFTNVGNITIGGDINGDSVQIGTTGGSITQNDPSAVITGTSAVVLSSTSLTDPNKVMSGSFGTADKPIQIDTIAFTPNTKGKIFVHNNNANPLQIIGGTQIGQLYLTSEGNVETSGEVGTKTSIISINAAGNINTTGIAGLFTGKAVTLISENGSIGNLLAFQQANIKTGNLTVGAADGQSILIGVSGNNSVLNVAQNTTNGTPDSLWLSAGDGVTGITYNSGISAISSVLLSTTAGSITNGSKGFIASNSVVLSAAKDVGTASMPILLKDATSSPTNIGLTAASTTGSVNVKNSGTQGLTLKDFPFLVTLTNSSAKAFTVKDSSGSLTVQDAITVGLPGDDTAKKTTNTLTLIETATTGTPSINVNGNLDVTGGGIVIQNMNTSGTIAFGTGITVDTLVDKNTPATSGNITIAIGKLPTTGFTVQSSPPDLTVNTDAGNKGHVTATNLDALVANGATLNALGRNIRFGGGGTGSINLNDAIITADPPGYATASGDSGNAGSGGNTLTLIAMGSGTGVPPLPPVPSGSTTGTLVISSSGSTTPPTNTMVPTNIVGAGGGITATGSISISGNSTTPFYSTNPPTGSTSLGGISSGSIVVTSGTSNNNSIGPTATSPYHPIAFVSGAASAFASRQPEGMSILAPTSDASIETPMGTLNIKAGAVVLAVIQSNGTVSVYNLHDNGSGDVTLETAGETATVVPGSHITVTPGTVREFGDVNAIECIAHRDVRTANKETATMFTSDFSVTSALKELPTLVEMRKSNDPAARRVAADIIKTAAILMQLGSSRGAYQRVTPKSHLTTAMQ